MGAVMEDAFPGILRWFLLGIGAAVIVAVYWVSRRGGGRSSAGERKMPTGLSADDVPADAQAVSETDPEAEPEIDLGADAPAPPPDRDEPASDPAPAPGRRIQQWVRRHAGKPDEASGGGEAGDDAAEGKGGGKLLVLHVRAKAEKKFAGAEILRIAEQTALERTAGGFFQRRAPAGGADSDGPPLFYLANMFSPGVFKWDEMDSFSTSGLSVFAQLPGALQPLETFDELLKCARLFAAKLQGVVLDESRSDLTAQTIQHIKEELQNYARGRVAPGLIK